MNSVHPEVADTTIIIKAEQQKQRMRRIQVWMAGYAMFLGLTSLFSVVGNSRFHSYHTLDVVRLVVAGMGFGVALVSLIHFFKSPGSRSAARNE